MFTVLNKRCYKVYKQMKKSETPPLWSPHPAGCGQTVHCEGDKEGTYADWEM